MRAAILREYGTVPELAEHPEPTGPDAVEVLAADPAGGDARRLGANQLEVAVLDRARPRRTFRRIVGAALERLLPTPAPESASSRHDEYHPAEAGPHERAESPGASPRHESTNPQTQRSHAEPHEHPDSD